MKRLLASLLTALVLLTFLPLASPSAQALIMSVGVHPTTNATRLKVEWSGLYNATYYHVGRSTDLKNWSIVRSTTGTSFTDTSLKPGTRYFYKLVYETPEMYYVQDKWSAGIPMGTGRITSLTSPSARRLRLTWAKTTGAAGYIVQMATSMNGNYKTVRITSGNIVNFSGVRSDITLYFRVFPYKRVYGTTYAGISSNVWYIRARAR